MNKKNPLFTSCKHHDEDCTCDNVFNELTPINPAQKLSVSAQAVPIIPAKARKSLDCLTRYREALEELLDAYGHYKIKVDGKEYKATLKAKQALQETQRKG